MQKLKLKIKQLEENNLKNLEKREDKLNNRIINQNVAVLFMHFREETNNQCDHSWLFLRGLCNKFSKIAQIFGNFLAILKSITF